MLALTEVTL